MTKRLEVLNPLVLAASIWRHRALPALLAAVLVPVPGALKAQEEPPPLVTDRPDQTESTAIVPRGSVQIEAGAKRDVDEVDGEKTISDGVGNFLLRIGLSRIAELRLGWNGLTARDQRSGTVSNRISGQTDASLGAKFHLATEKGRRPAMAVIAFVSVPSGRDEFTSDGFDPGALFAFSHTISDRIGLGYNAGLVFESTAPEGEDRQTLSTWTYAIASGFSLSEKVGTFVEVFGSAPASASGSSAHSFDAGLTWLVRPNLQLDTSAGVGLNDGATDWFVSVGFSVRLPR